MLLTLPWLAPADDLDFYVDAQAWLALAPGDTLAAATDIVVSPVGGIEVVDASVPDFDLGGATLRLRDGSPGVSGYISMSLRSAQGRVEPVRLVFHVSRLPGLADFLPW
jgi:hypothetical protein